jgi:hypothetical protein
LLLSIALVACRREPESEERAAKPKTSSPKTVAKSASPPEEPADPSGPRYLRANSQGELVDAFQFPSVPADIVEKQVANASSKSDVAGVLRRFGLGTLEGKTGHVWIAKASLVDRLGRERVLVASFTGEANSDGVRDEAARVVFLGSTEDDRVLKVGDAQIKSKSTNDTPIEVDAHELHSAKFDDVVATWSFCTKPMQKGCHFLRAWTMQRGYPEQIADVSGDSKPTISGGSPPHDIVVDGRTLKFDAAALAYK